MGTQEPAKHSDQWKVKALSMKSKPMGWSLLALAFALAIGVAPEFKKLDSFSEALTPEFLGQHLYIWGSVGTAWLSGFLRNKS